MPEQPYPFSKNRYFKGKRMRAADFQREQACVEHKLAVLNHWVLGEGIALGLGVQRVDSDSLMVEPGLALDTQGRTLIVDEPAICRLRALQGFHELTGETALLWLSYREEPFDPMFLADERGEGQDFAAARERFAFSLTPLETLLPAAPDRILLSDTVLYEDGDLRVRQVIPRVFSARGGTQIRLVLECFDAEPIDVELTYAPEVPGFTLAGGGAVQLSRRLRLRSGETALVLEVITNTGAQAVSVSLGEEGFLLSKRGVGLRAQCGFREEFFIAPGNPLEELENRLSSLAPQELWDHTQEGGVPVAALRFVRYDDNCLLDDVIALGGERRVKLPYLQERLRRCGTFFSTPPPPREAVRPFEAREAPEPRNQGCMTTGTVTLSAGMNLDEGKILRSDEIAHGLGPGTVFVQFGVENVSPAVNLHQNRTDLLLGDESLFEQVSGTLDRALDRGVRVHPDKGTFELAVRLRSQLRQSALRLRWFAWRPDGRAEHEAEQGALLRLEPDVIHVEPGAVVNFIPVFSGGAGAPCDFFVVGKQAGTVTRDGVYSAPEKDGLYQVCAQARDRPDEKVNAFVIVRREASHAAGAV